jgi:hypothetical protein
MSIPPALHPCVGAATQDRVITAVLESVGPD